MASRLPSLPLARALFAALAGLLAGLPVPCARAQELPAYYVSVTNANPAFPYTSWATAATNIQDAVNAGTVTRRTVLVTNGVYQTGVTWVAGPTNLTMAGGSTNRVALTNVVLRSVNGPEVTIIDGAEVVSGVYLGANAVLDGFTVRNGCAWPDEAAIARWESELGGGFVFGCGGGVNSTGSGVVTNCVLSNNKALSVSSMYMGDCCPPTFWRTRGVGMGGGACGVTLYNCVLTGNSAGGAVSSTLYHCTLIRNVADSTPGFPDSTLYYNCILEPNVIEADRAFVNAAAGDFRLRYGSPYIDAGAALDIPLTHDLDGLPRPLDGDGDGRAVPDKGAYEFDLRTLVPADWFTQYNLDASDPHVLSGNPDEDGQTSFQEWLAGTDPRDPLSFFRIEAVEAGPPARLIYRGLRGRMYSLYTATDLAGGSGGTTPWAPVLGQRKLPGSGGLDSLTDTNALPRRFYRVGVELP